MTEQDYELPETHIERMDRLTMEHEQKLERERLIESGNTERARIKLRERRQETYQNVGIAFVVGLVILGIVAAIYFGSTGGTGEASKAQIEQQRESRCLDSGGGWVPDDLIVAGDSGICVFPGKVASND